MTSSAPLRRRAPVALLVTLSFLSLGCAQGKERAAAAAPVSTPAAAPSVATSPVATPPAPALLDVTMKNARQAGELAAQIPPGSLAERFVHASALFLGVPYQDGPLGEGDVGGVDPDPRVDFDRADCVTLERSRCAGAAGGHPVNSARFGRARSIRYRGQAGHAQPLLKVDWAPANAWRRRDEDAPPAPGVAGGVVRTIDRAKFRQTREQTPGVHDAGRSP
jgi:hypothetical protein